MKADSSHPRTERPPSDSLFGVALNGSGSGMFLLIAMPSIAAVGNAFDYAESDWSSRAAIWLGLLLLVTISAVKRFSAQGLGVLWYILSLYVFVLLKLGVGLEVYDFVAGTLFALLSWLAYTRCPSRVQEHHGE